VLVKKYKTFMSLTSIERRNFFISLPLIPIVALSVKTFGYKRSLKWLATPPIQTPATADSQLKLEQIESGFWLALKYSPYQGTCLSRSLLLMTLLHRQNVPTNLRIGFELPLDRFKAHAWLESGEAVLRSDKTVNKHYVPFDQGMGTVGGKVHNGD
jgi:hypothetical protein